MVATIALFVVLGGGAYAAFHLHKNSVRSKHIVNGQVKSRDVANGAISASKLQPLTYTDAGLRDFPGSCVAANGWFNLSNRDPASYARDGFGLVQLRGQAIRCGVADGSIFVLPPGFRPAKGAYLPAVSGNAGPGYINVLANGEVRSDISNGDNQSLDGPSFRCSPSGQSGCP